MKTFSVPFTDDIRILYAAKHLEEIGFIKVKNVNESDFVLLPVPAKKYMIDAAEGKEISYSADEAFLLENAYLTAEGALALLKETSDKAIYSSRILITGYGRIARALHRALSALGAKITVCARSDTNRVEAAANGAYAIDFDKLKNKNEYDFVFNTVPHLVFTKAELDALEPDAVIYDLSSFPGGVDTLYAKSKGLRLVNGRGMPGKYSPKTAGILIAKTVIKMTKEESA